jgi:hypothetical protein
MDDAKEHPRGGITQIVAQGFMAPPMLAAALIANALLLGGVLVAMAWLREDSARLYTEVRILSVHVEDQNAILIREGLKKPNDEHYGPTGH